MNKLNIFTDGGSRGNPGPAACSFVVLDGSGKMIEKRGKYLGITTNNIAEYQAIIFALEWLIGKADTLLQTMPTINFFSDSKLVVSQLNGIFKVKKPDIRNIIIIIREKEISLPVIIKYNLIPREKNFLADEKVNSTLDIIFP